MGVSAMQWEGKQRLSQGGKWWGGYFRRAESYGYTCTFQKTALIWMLKWRRSLEQEPLCIPVAESVGWCWWPLHNSLFPEATCGLCVTQ